MTIPHKKLDLDPFPGGVLTTTIQGEIEGGAESRVLQVQGEAVVVLTVTEEELLDEKQGVTIIFTGQDNLKLFLYNAMISWCTMEGELSSMIAHLIRRHPEEYFKAQIEAIALNLKEATHDARDPKNP